MGEWWLVGQPMGWVSLMSQSSASVRPIWRSSGPTLHIHNITHVFTTTFFLKSQRILPTKKILFLSVVDLDLEVFGHPGSGSIIICRDPEPDPSIIKQKK
jgi:hypothetical protein